MRIFIKMDTQHCLLIAAAMCLLSLIQFSSCQQIPTFTVGTFFPTRPSLSAFQTEEAVCRVITDQIRRNSARFNSELVTNNNGGINFAIEDARIMSSRMQSRLDNLANRYFSATNRRMTIQKAWTPFPDPQLNGVPGSLHYEGNKTSEFVIADVTCYKMRNAITITLYKSTCGKIYLESYYASSLLHIHFL